MYRKCQKSNFGTFDVTPEKASLKEESALDFEI